MKIILRKLFVLLIMVMTMWAVSFNTVKATETKEPDSILDEQSGNQISDEQGAVPEGAKLGVEEIKDGDQTLIPAEVTDGVPLTDLPGWKAVGENWYYYDADGRRAEGWRLINGSWYYLDGSNEENPGVMLSSGFHIIDGMTYGFDANGAMLTGWIQEPEGWYYASGSGALAEGWAHIGGTWYYLNKSDTSCPYLMACDEKKEIEGQIYFFNQSGAMLTGWVQRPEGWYYANDDGSMHVGWRNLGEKWYYLDSNNADYPGLMVCNTEKVVDNATYVFLADGAMRSGWYQDPAGDWYYYDLYSGQIVSGWKNIGGTWYYFEPAEGNKMVCNGWKVIGNSWYYFYNSGAMAVNWLNLGGNWYYMASDGAMKTGWQLIGGTWYYFYLENDSHGGSYGMMARNTSIDGWQLMANGAMITGHQAQMTLKTQLYSSNTNYLILVDRAACKVAIYSGSAGAWNLLHYWSCSPGKPSTPTVSGTFTVQSKGHHFDSGSARCYWYTQFHGNYLFHSVLYNKYNGALSDGRLGMQLSHGCVRLDINNAKWIYDNIPRGTKVVIY